MTAEMSAAVAAFLLAFPALFSIVNPAGGAFIFNEVTADLTHAERAALAGKVALYSTLVLLGALWGGAYILNFFGISLGALRVAGGVFVALRAWDLLSAPERQEERKQAQAGIRWPRLRRHCLLPAHAALHHRPGHDLRGGGAQRRRPAGGAGLLRLLPGRQRRGGGDRRCWSGSPTASPIGSPAGSARRRGARIARLTAFLLLCIGTQITINGVEDVVLTLAHTVSSTPQ